MHDTRTNVRSIANEHGELVPVDPPTGDGETADVAASSMASTTAGDGPAAGDPSDGTAGRRPLGLAARVAGACAGIAAIVLASRGVTRRAATTLALAGACVLSAACIADPPVDGEDAPPPLTPEQASLHASYAKSAERIARFRQSAILAIHDRTVRDFALTSDQAALCLAVLNDYVNVLTASLADARSRLEMWDRTYWTERRQRERGVHQIEPQRPGDAGLRRVESTQNDDGTTNVRIYPAEDEIYQLDRYQFLARDRRDNLDPVRNEAAKNIFGTIEAILTEEQQCRWERAKRRLWIGLEEGLTPRAGGRPNAHVDMLGLIDEACAPGAEWAHRSATLLFALDGADAGSSTDSDPSFADMLAAFPGTTSPMQSIGCASIGLVLTRLTQPWTTQCARMCDRCSRGLWPIVAASGLTCPSTTSGTASPRLTP